MVAETSNVLHSWCVQAEWNAPTVVGGRGAWFWDEAGRHYLDMSSLAECMNLGHQLIERSRNLGREMLRRLQAMQRAHTVIGDVRWGGGLFAIVELVRDRRTREPLAAWPSVHPAMNSFVGRARERGVSFAIRGNLIILAPPLVILENDLQLALDTMDRLLGELDWTT